MTVLERCTQALLIVGLILIIVQVQSSGESITDGAFGIAAIIVMVFASVVGVLINIRSKKYLPIALYAVSSIAFISILVFL